MRGKQGLLLIATFLAACALLIFPAEAAAGAKSGIGYCLQILVPSLYPFMVLSVFVVKCGLSEKIGRLFEAPTRAILKLPGSTAATLLMSAIGGYPTGARGIAALYDAGAISENQAAKMLCFCVNAGPAFVISAVGIGFLRSARAGVILFASQLLASIVLSVLCGVTAKSEKSVSKPKQSSSKKVADALVASASDAAHAMINMCCFVVLFAAILNLLRIWVNTPKAGTALSALVEVTGGCSDLAKLGVPLWVFSFALGWGGISVHFQILSSISNIKTNLARFIFFRLLHGALAGLITTVLITVYPLDAEVFSNTSVPLSGSFSGSIPAAVALIALCAALIFSLPHEKLEIDER